MFPTHINSLYIICNETWIPTYLFTSIVHKSVKPLTAYIFKLID